MAAREWPGKKSAKTERMKNKSKKPGVGSTYNQRLEEGKQRSPPSTRSSISWKPETSIASLSVQEERSLANSARRAVSASYASFCVFVSSSFRSANCAANRSCSAASLLHSFPLARNAELASLRCC